jgi:uncharacterized protein (DUF697 family)
MTSYAEDGRAVSPLSEDRENELASELMDVGSDAELDHFFGGLIGTITRDAGRFLRSPVGHALGGILKGVAKKALPMVGGALGSAVAPGIGTMLGSQLGSIASNLFEMELGPMPEEEAGFEVARRLVQLMAAAVSQAVQAPPQPGVSPKAAAWESMLRASREYAPGLYRQLTQRPGRPNPGGRRMPAPRPGRGPHPGFPGQNGHGRPAGGGFVFGGPVFGEPVFGEPVMGEPVMGEPVVEEPILPDWDPAAGPDGQPSLEVGDQPRQAASGTWERRGRRIILRGV